MTESFARARACRCSSPSPCSRCRRGWTVGQAVPAETRSFLGARLGGVGAVARQVLGAAAAIGRSFDFDTVLAASGRSDEEAVAALEELVEHGLVREPGAAEARYDFTHQRLRELVYEETSPARRRLLHRRIAASLPRTDETAALVAQQLRLAGEPREAAEQFRIAAEHAASLLAHADALAHLEAALALDPLDAAALHERIGDLRTLVGDYGGALASYEQAAAESEGARWRRSSRSSEASTGAAATGSAPRRGWQPPSTRCRPGTADCEPDRR